MSRKAKYTSIQKIQACEDYCSGKKSANEIATELRMGKRGDDRVRRWANMYRKYGPIILEESHHNSHYSKELKVQAVEEYLSGSSLQDVCIKYCIRSCEQLRNWILKYNSHKELEDYAPHPEVYMANRKKTTKEERIEIVRYCLDHHLNYSETALKYGCSYSQVYQWVRKYQANGSDALTDNRGQKKDEGELTELEKAQRRIKQLEHENMLKDREIEILKKFEELERRWL